MLIALLLICWPLLELFVAFEVSQLIGVTFKPVPEPTVRDYLTPWTAARAEKQFLARFKLLLG